MPYLLAALASLGLTIALSSGYEAPQTEPFVGAFGDPYLSRQVGSGPSNGEILQTDGTNSTWVATSTLGFSSGSSGNFLATTTPWTVGNLAAVSSDSALYSEATTTLTASSPLSLSATVFKVGGSNSVLSLDTSGTWTGNAGTASALAANGTNCSAGSGAGGVNAAGNAEDCTDYEQNLTAGDHLTRTGDDFDVDDDFILNTGDTGTGNYTFSSGLFSMANASSTLFSSGYASSTLLYAGTLNLPSLGTAAGAFLAVDPNGAVIATTTPSSGSSFGYPFPSNATSTQINFTSGLILDNGDTGSGVTLAAESAPGSVTATFPMTSGTVALGTGASTRLAYWSGTNSLTSNANLTFATPTTTAANLTVTTAVSILGEYFTNFTTYVRSLFTGGDHITITSGDIDVDDDFLLNTGDTGTGAYDFGGATSLEMVNGSNPTVDAIGEFALDTTGNQLLIATSTNAATPAVFMPFITIPGGHATSTWVGTTTQTLGPAPGAGRFIGGGCNTLTGTVGISLYDDSGNRMDYFVASSTAGFITFTTNTTFNFFEGIRLDMGTPASSPTQVACRFKFVYDRL